MLAGRLIARLFFYAVCRCAPFRQATACIFLPASCCRTWTAGCSSDMGMSSRSSPACIAVAAAISLFHPSRTIPFLEISAADPAANEEKPLLLQLSIELRDDLIGLRPRAPKELHNVSDIEEARLSVIFRPHGDHHPAYGTGCAGSAPASDCRGRRRGLAAPCRTRSRRFTGHLRPHHGTPRRYSTRYRPASPCR